MQRLTLFAVALLSFGAGFFAGRHSGDESTSDTRLESRIGQGPVGTDRSAVVPQGASVAGTRAETASSVRSPAPPATAQTAAKGGVGPPHSRPGAAPPGVGLPPQLLLTPEEQADLAVQHWEVQQANIRQMEAMIHSLEESGVPEDQIAHFRKLKDDLKTQSGEEAAHSEGMPSERTEEELRNDFAASLEQSDMPPAELEQMIEALGSTPTPESPPMEMSPSQGPER